MYYIENWSEEWHEEFGLQEAGAYDNIYELMEEDSIFGLSLELIFLVVE